MNVAKIIRAGCRQDGASVNRANRTIALLAEANPGKRFELISDPLFQKKQKQGRGIAALLPSLLENRVDVLIDDVSNIPLNLPAGIEISAVLKRGNPFNVLVSSSDLILEEQPEDVPIAVKDLVSKGQLLYFRSGLTLVDAEGGFEALYAMLERGEIGGFVIDAAEVEELSAQEKVVEVFTSSMCMPAAGQGATAVIARKGDRRIRSVTAPLDHLPSYSEVRIERMLLAGVSRDGRGPVGVLGKVEEEEFQINAVIVAPDGSEKIGGAMKGYLGEEQKTLQLLASQLLESGGKYLVR